MGPLAIDRTVRLLTSLNRASTSRVLNLAMIAQAHAEDPDHRRQPLFVSPALNSCILLKHRVRADDSYVLGDSRAVATKIIIPFDPADLKAGGRSFLVGQRGFRDILAEIGQYRGDTGVERDIKVLQVIARVPSLDPFLLREQLRGNGFTCADCYFEINPADQQRMHSYVSNEVHRLIELAGAGGDGDDVLGLDAPDAEADPMYDQAVGVVLQHRRASISLVQRHLRIGYNRAARLLEQMEKSGLVSSMATNGNRDILVPARAE